MVFIEKEIWCARTAYRLLKGVFCIHKPKDWGVSRTRHCLQLALCNDLNNLEAREPTQRVEIAGSFRNENFQVLRYQSFADSPLALGPRYTPDDIKLTPISVIPYMASGLSLFAVGATQRDLQLRQSTMVSTYQLHCKLGAMTDDGTTTGRVMKRTRFYHVSQGVIERFLSAMQASHQKKAFEYAGVDLTSQEAFEIAKEGLVRPQQNTMPLIYSLKCIELEHPSFTLEVQIIHETELFLRTLVSEIAQKLRTTAAVENMRRVRFGPFKLDQALIKNFWTLENVINNIRETEEPADLWRYPKLMGVADPHKKNLVLLKKI